MYTIPFRRATGEYVYTNTDSPISSLLRAQIPSDTETGTLVLDFQLTWAAVTLDGRPAQQLSPVWSQLLCDHYQELDVDTELEEPNDA